METLTLAINMNTHKHTYKRELTDFAVYLHRQWKRYLKGMACPPVAWPQYGAEESTPSYKRQSWGFWDQWKHSWWSFNKSRWRINKLKCWCLERFSGSSPCCLASCYAINTESLKYTPWHTTSRMQLLSSGPVQPRISTVIFGEITNIISPSGVPFWRGGEQQGLQAAARLASESTSHQLRASAVCWWADEPTTWFSVSHSQWNQWVWEQTWTSLYEAHRMTLVWFNFLSYPAHKQKVLNPVWLSATHSSCIFQDCISECWEEIKNTWLTEQ